MLIGKIFWTFFWWALLAMGAAIGSEKVYEGHQQVKGQQTIHYYLTERMENERRVFALFTAFNDELQDLTWERSFGIEQSELSDNWQRAIARKYHLTLRSEKGQDAQEAVAWKRSPNSPVLWRAEQEWNNEWEAEFGLWATTTLTPQLMVEIQQPTDCADVAYLLRWAFARIHKLPMAVRLAGSNQLFTNETLLPDWAKLPVNDQNWRTDQRFRAAMNYLLRNTYTHTLMKDSYPVAINTHDLTPGTYHLELHGESGHTMLVDSVNRPGQMPITLLYSTVPARVRQLIPTFYMNQEVPTLFKSGFYKLRWALQSASRIQLLAAKSIPGYSEEQFQLANQNAAASSNPHFLNVFKKINPQFSFQLMLDKSWQELQERVQDRIKIVEEGYNYCLEHDCRPGSQGDEDWSTPSRDKRLREIHSTINLAGTLLLQSDPQAFQTWSPLAEARALSPNLVIGGEHFSLAEIIVALIHQLMESDPRLPIVERWGLSLEGIFSTLQKKLSSTLALRKTLVGQAQICRASHCPPKSEIYQKLNTLQIDHALGLQWVGAQALCRWRSAKHCQELRERLANLVIDQISADQWLEKLPLWIADPNALLSSRWGFPGQIFRYNDLPQGSQIFFSKDRQWFSIGPQLYQTENFVPVSMGEDETFGALNPSNNQYFTYHFTAETIALRFYQLPRLLIGAIDLEESAGDRPVRIFWSGLVAEKATVAVFTQRNFYQISSAGQIVNKFQYAGFVPTKNDPHLLIMQTDQGIFVGDALKNASVWMPMRLPLAIAELETFFIAARTNRGIVLRNDRNRLLYVEEALGVLLDWQLDGPGTAYFSPDGQYVAKTNAEKTAIEIYQRQQEYQDHQGQKSSGHRVQYALKRSLPGILFYGQEHFLQIFHEMRQRIFSLQTMDYFSPNCAQPSLAHTLLSHFYYACQGENYSELHRFDGQLLHVSDLGGHWAFTLQDDRFWMSNFSPDEASLALTTQVFGLINDVWVGPIVQSYQELNLQDVHLMGDLTSGASNQIAPVLLEKGVLTNFGVIQALPHVISFILDKVVKFPIGKQLLFLPEMGGQKSASEDR